MRPWSVRDLGPKGLLFATLAAGPLLAEDRAVVVGIDEYSALQPGLALEGAVAERVRDTLVGTFGLTREQVTLLANEAATSEAILSAVTDELIGQTGPGDQAFLYFAGLGTRVAEEDGTTLLALVAGMLTGSWAGSPRTSCRTCSI